MSSETYLKLPNIPQRKVTSVLLDYRASKKIISVLEQINIRVLVTKKLDTLYPAVCGHPDMQIHHLGENKFVCEPSLAEYYKKILPNAVIFSGDSIINANYPCDIAYNAARAGNFVFHNLRYTDYKIFEYYKSIGVKLINVKQGYTKCSICVIDENAIITSDRKIAQTAENNDFDVLYVNPSDIKLQEISNGLVGGICGLIDKNTLIINGNIEKLADGKKFLDFCENHRTNVLSVGTDTPEDIGSILPLTEAE